MGAEDALKKYYQRIHKENVREQRPARKNGKPEFLLTKKPCMKWFEENGFSMNTVESKAVYSFELGRYAHGQTEAGVADSMGCTPHGLFAAAEFKAPGKRSTLKPHQREWLIQKITKGAFAVCVDSAADLANVWNEFAHRRKVDPELAKAYLLRHLPPEKARAGEDELPG